MKSLLAAIALLALAPIGYAQSLHTPVCLPKPVWPVHGVYGSLPSGISARYDTYAAWVCETPTGYAAEAMLFALGEVAPDAMRYAANLVSVGTLSSQVNAGVVANTATEQSFLDGQIKAVFPNALVAFNGSNTTRSVYQSNADGTLNPTPVTGASIAVAAKCNPGLRIAGTAYYSVQGQPNASASGQILGSVFAVCVVSLPLGAN